MLQWETEHCLPVSGGAPYLGLAFDGRRYFLTVQGRREMVVMDGEFSPGAVLETERPYTALCYDPDRACFWAASDTWEGAVFRLDGAAREVDCLMLEGLGRVTGLSYDCGSRQLLLARGNRLLRLDPEARKAVCLRQERGGAIFCTVLGLVPYILCTVLREHRLHWLLLDFQGVAVAEAPEKWTVRALLLEPCRGKPTGVLGLGMGSSAYPVLLRGTLEKGLAEELAPCNRAVCREKAAVREADGLLAAVAMEEAALARILHGAGERLEKGLSQAQSPQELLDLAEAVQRTLLCAAQLEQARLPKLEALEKLGGSTGE